MRSASSGFPRNLLNESPQARLAHFQTYTMAHPRLIDAKDQLVSAIQGSEPNTLILVIGPTGVGKTTLRVKTEQILTEQLREEVERDRGRIPVVGMEAVAPESGNFSWSDHFRRLLHAMDEPLVDYKYDPETTRAGRRSFFGARPTTAAYRHAVEQALRFRRPRAVMVDEAQHIAKMSSSRRLLDQLDVLKSIANTTRVLHVLFGTYDLLLFRNLNGQLSRRSIDIHFRRYRAEVTSDRHIFISIVRSFCQQMPLPEPPDLTADWEFLYERSLGCVGVLKQWLATALHAALMQGEETVSRKLLECHALSVSQCEKMFAEANRGEIELTEKHEDRSRLQKNLGLRGQTDLSRGEGERSNPPVTRNNVRPGQRRPVRDPVGEPKVPSAKSP